jgi:DmsE family decaheme c-type cytochrome
VRFRLIALEGLRFLGWALLALVLLTTTACNNRHRGARRGESDVGPYVPRPEPQFQEARLASLQVPIPEIKDAEYVNDDELCMTCHETYTKTFQHNVHRGQSCEKCHGPASRHLGSRGREPGSILNFKRLQPPEKAELCLKCHEEKVCSPGAQWRTSPHAHNGVACTDCHTNHYNVPPGTQPTQLAEKPSPVRNQLVSFLQSQPPIDQDLLRKESRKLGAISPHICLRCHSNKDEQQNFAASHQVCGAVGLNCTTCHDPHGKIRPETRTNLCLECHGNRAPTMAWPSCTHSRYGVACADCHIAHPRLQVQPVLNIQHTNIARPVRSPMGVDEPRVCYKCHSDIYAKNAMPSHHPIKEGKMVCSDCHDPHGQAQDNLQEATVNMVCYKCHAEKQGPFAYEHPPVTENCDYCHEPHGTVANNLLRQPPAFLCLRCHSGHRTVPGHPGGAPLQDVAGNRSAQRSFYTDCTQCHSQIHGSDVPSPHLPKAFLR